jgi:hypothetical protein
MKHAILLILLILFVSACNRKLRQELQVFPSPDKILEARIVSEYGGMSQWRSKTSIRNIKTGMSETILIESGARATAVKWISPNKLQIIACSGNIKEFKSYIYLGDEHAVPNLSIPILIDLQTTEIGNQGSECKISDRNYLAIFER